MKTIRTIAEMRAELTQPRAEQHRIGLVPTMGSLHDGHVSLIHRAREESDVVVMSLFVNPTQFNESADLLAYPRDEARDAELAAQAGVDIMFAPEPQEIYPPGFELTVRVGGVTEVLEGESRGRAHFDGVTTVVTKLFNIVQPHAAYFGQKDAQQCAVIRKLVRDLSLPVRIEVCPTVRDPDGLALSSRNVQLSPQERLQALSLSRALTAAAAAAMAGARNAEAVRIAAQGILDDAGVRTEYFQLVDPDTLVPVDRIDGPVLALVAAQVGRTRLIDNQLLTTVPVTAGSINDWRT
jgi:pantoate--beta-alanine ligase